MGWKRVRSIGRGLAPALLLTLALVVGSRNAGRGQPVITQVSNNFVSAQVGVSGTMANVTPNVNAAGRFGVVANGTIPAVLMQMGASIRKQSYVTVRIDGGPPTPGNDADTQTKPGWDLIWGDVGSNALDATTTSQKTDQSAWIQQPTVVGSNQIVARWQTLPGANTTVPIPPIEIDLTLTLVYDMVSYEFTVINRDTSSHTIGLRFGQDYELPGAVDAPVFTPTTGNITTETDLASAFVPPYWRAINGSTGATVGGQLTSTGSQGNQNNPAQRLTFGNNGDAIADLWTFLNGGQRIVDGSAGVYYFESQYAPTQSRTIRTFFGKMHSTIDFDVPMAVGVDGPLTLSFDPTKPVGQQLTPNPFTVTAFAQNLTAITLTNVSATINLPAGLTLAAGEPITRTTGSLGVGGDTTFIWHVVPTGTASGTLTYTVAFSAGPGAIGKSVARTIEIPAQPSQTFQGNGKWNMVSFPYTFDDPSPSVALGLDPATFTLVHWDQASAQWQVATALTPGVGYFFSVASTTTVSLVGAHPVSTTADWPINLSAGWNQIGNPWLLPVQWSDAKVISTDPSDPDRFQPLSVAVASDARHGWIQPTLFWWDATQPGKGAYEWSSDFSTNLVPFVGYFLRANKPGLTLLIPKPANTRAASTRSTTTWGPAPGGTGWRLQLVASSAIGRDARNFLGMQTGASDGDDILDVQKPPAVSGTVSLALVRDAVGGRSATYAQDIRALGGRREWTAIVNSGAANSDVTITWPNVGTLSRAYELYIVDPARGQRMSMRQASSLRVRTGDTGTAQLTIIAEPRTGAGVFRILNWTANPSRAQNSVAVSVTTTQDANLSVRVINSAGKVLRTLGSRASTGRSATLMWDYRDSRGIAVPSGMYIIEVRGTTPDGQSATVPIPHLITR